MPISCKKIVPNLNFENKHAFSIIYRHYVLHKVEKLDISFPDSWRFETKQNFLCNFKKIGGNYKAKDANNSSNASEEIDFQNYVNSVKEKKTPWNIFESMMKYFIHSDVKRLKLINAILLTELTPNCSDIDRLKYLNVILLAEFKDFIERENDFENEYLDEPQILMDHNTDLNNKISEEQSEIQTFEIINAERKNLEDLKIENTIE